MFRPFIGSLSGLLLNEVNECYVHVRIPTMLSNSRNVTYVKIELHKIDGIVYNKKSGFYFSAGTRKFPLFHKAESDYFGCRHVPKSRCLLNSKINELPEEICSAFTWPFWTLLFSVLKTLL